MKHQISITVEEETLLKAKDKLREGLFRNKSHLIDYALKKFLEEN
jgi:Arc/MetJ-type ribon-helix-helix transcriptional regulator